MTLKFEEVTLSVPLKPQKRYDHNINRWVDVEADSPRIIGLAGRARSGKDTVAGMLADAFPVARVSFAEPIRSALAAIFGFDRSYFEGAKKEEVIEWIGKSPRQMMQTLGTEWGRDRVNQDIWLLIAQRKVREANDDGLHAVVTDVRFENEAKAIRAMGGQIWHIFRGDIPAVNAHASEAGVEQHPNSDVLIFNNGTLNELQDQVFRNFYN